MPGGRGAAGAGPGGRGAGPMGGARGAVAPSAVVPGQGAGGEGGASAPLTTAMLAAAPAEQQKQMLGERLFPLVAARPRPELAGKVTGMLLEMDNAELLLLLESPDALDAKVEEAIAVLKQHGALPGADGAGAAEGAEKKDGDKE